MTDSEDSPNQQPAAAPPPGYSTPHQPATYPPAPNPYPHNWMAIVALIVPFAGFSIPGIVFGHLALNACKKGLANNRGIALAGTIVSYVYTALAAIVVIGYVVFAFALFNDCVNNPDSSICTVDYENFDEVD